MEPDINLKVSRLLPPTSMSGRFQVNMDRMEEAIDVIMQANPTWRPNENLLKKVMILTEGKAPAIRRKIACRFCCTQLEDGVISITKSEHVSKEDMKALIQASMQKAPVLVGKKFYVTKDSLDNIDSKFFWEKIEELQVTKLSVRTPEKKFVYGILEVAKLVEQKPELCDLVNEFELECRAGFFVKQSKAKFRLCGDYFNEIFDSPNKHMINQETAVLHNVSINGFSGILEMIETGRLSPEIILQEFQSVADFLLFKSPIFLKGIYGKEHWETLCKIDEAAPHTKEFTQWLQEICPIDNSGKTRLETHVVAWIPPRVNGKWTNVLSLGEIWKISYDKNGFYEPIGTDNEINAPFEKGRWVAMYIGNKGPLEAGKGREDHLNYIKANYPGYRLPKVCEAIICGLLPMNVNGKNILPRTGPVKFTRCLEKIGKLATVFGMLGPSGASVDCVFGSGVYIGFFPVREFC